MATQIHESYLDLFERPAYAHLATIMADGSPQVTPVWVDFDGTHLLINSAKGRVKDLNMSARPQVAVEIMDPDTPYRYLAVRGRVVEIIEEGAAEHINNVLAPKYTGETGSYGGPDEIRRIYKISVEKVDAHG